MGTAREGAEEMVREGLGTVDEVEGVGVGSRDPAYAG